MRIVTYVYTGMKIRVIIKRYTNLLFYIKMDKTVYQELQKDVAQNFKHIVFYNMHFTFFLKTVSSIMQYFTFNRYIVT